jgi:hypothetical protein
LRERAEANQRVPATWFPEAPIQYHRGDHAPGDQADRA